MGTLALVALLAACDATAPTASDAAIAADAAPANDLAHGTDAAPPRDLAAPGDSIDQAVADTITGDAGPDAAGDAATPDAAVVVDAAMPDSVPPPDLVHPACTSYATESGAGDIDDTAAWQTLPVAGVSAATSGGCNGDASCLAALAVADGSYLQWLACDTHGGSVWGNPTDLQFALPSGLVPGDATFTLIAAGESATTAWSLDCLDASLATIAHLVPTGVATPANPLVDSPFAQTTGATYVVEVPLACLAQSPVTLRLASTGGCVAADYAALHVRSSAVNKVVNKHQLEGYASPSSVAPGETLRLMVHAPNPETTVELVRLGLVAPGGVAQVTTTSLGAPVPLAQPGAQDYPASAWRDGAGWSASHTIAVPQAWTSGVYAAHLVDAWACYEAWIPFVVRELVPGASTQVALLVDTNAWAAQNDWGGASAHGYRLHNDDPTQPYLRDGSARATAPQFAHWSSYDRPDPGASPLATAAGHGMLLDAELATVGWLDHEGVLYGALTDRDLHEDAAAHAGGTLLGHYRTLVVDGHDEAWTREMRDALDTFVAGGGQVIDLGGQTAYWKVTLAGGQLELRADGTMHAQTSTVQAPDPGGAWQDVGRPEARVLGVAVDARTNPDWLGHAGPYQALLPSHWAFVGSNLATGASFGTATLDDVYGAGASGYVTADVTSDTPATTLLLAEGLEDAGIRGADLVWTDGPPLSPGGVLAAGSLAFGPSLLVDGDTARIARNALGHRRAPIASVSASGSCAGCVAALNTRDGNYLQWLACNHNNADSATEYATPTDLVFAVPEWSHLAGAVFSIDAQGGGADATIAVTCVDGNGATLATLQPATAFATTAATYRWPVPAACFASSTVRIRLARSGADCLAVDEAQLDVVAANVPIAQVTATGTCAGCQAALGQHDGNYLQWIACRGTNQDSATEWGSPMDVELDLPEYASVDGANLILDGYGGGPDALYQVNCVDASGNTLTAIASSVRVPTSPHTFVWRVPALCFASSRLHVRLVRQGNDCLAADYFALGTW